MLDRPDEPLPRFPTGSAVLASLLPTVSRRGSRARRGPVLSRGAFASIAYATPLAPDRHGAGHARTLAAEAGKLVTPLPWFVCLGGRRFVVDAGAWFSSYNTRSPMLLRIKEEVFAYTQRLSSSYFENTLSGKITAPSCCRSGAPAVRHGGVRLHT